MHSEWDCTLEGLPHPPAVRLGLRLVAGLKAESALRILKARRERPFDGADDLARRAEHRAARDDAAGRCRCADEPVRPSTTAGLGGRGAALGAAVAEAGAGQRGRARTAGGARGRRGRLGLRGHGPHAAPASAGHPAAGAGQAGVVHGGRAARLARRPAGAGLRHRDGAPAAGDRQGRDVRVAGGRDRQRAGDRVAQAQGAAARAAAAFKADGGEGHLAARWRRAQPDRRACRGSDGACWVGWRRAAEIFTSRSMLSTRRRKRKKAPRGLRSWTE